MTLIEKLEDKLYRLRKKQRFEEDECLELQYKDNADGFKWALDIAKQHQDESGWIACSECMPPNNTMVMAFTHFEEIVFAFTMLEDNTLTWCRDCSSDEWTVEQITHWMPMPMPPKQ